MEQRKLLRFEVVGCPACREKNITTPEKSRCAAAAISVGSFETNVTHCFTDFSVATLRGFLSRLSLESLSYGSKERPKVWNYLVSRLARKKENRHRNISRLAPERFFRIVWQHTGLVFRQEHPRYESNGNIRAIPRRSALWSARWCHSLWW